MIFSSVFFLYFFLPITLIVYFFAGSQLRNIVLLVASLIFYAWGEVGYVFLMLFSILLNWLLGLLLEKTRSTTTANRTILVCGIIANLIPLLFFKYGNFFVDNFNKISTLLNQPTISVEAIHLPIGISFFTFQAISYIVDVYRKEAQLQRNPINLALYISLFPQLIAGPIVRYHDVAKQIVERHVSLDDLRYGMFRFVMGLGKKVLIANHLGAAADHIFSLSPEGMPAGLLWLGMLAFTLQLYYDFSGYSDMAIGLGRMFGFRFLENFNYPYCATSIQGFWRRWHISLSSWFRDYLYIPLGGNRKGEARTYANLLIVFLLCGLWHGASWTFAVWGLFHGFFLILERSPVGLILKRLPFVVRYCYTLLVVMVGWVFFRADTLEYAIKYLKSLMNFWEPGYLDGHLFTALNNEFYLALFIGVIFATPLFPFLQKKWMNCFTTEASARNVALDCASNILLVCFMSIVFIYGTAQIISGSHNPFLYFRF